LKAYLMGMGVGRFGVWGLGFGVWGLGFEVYDMGLIAYCCCVAPAKRYASTTSEGVRSALVPPANRACCRGGEGGGEGEG
jgi:hypothetical protein